MAEDLGAIDGLDVCCKFLCEVRIGIRIITNEILKECTGLISSLLRRKYTLGFVVDFGTACFFEEALVAELPLNWDKFGALLPVCDALFGANLPKLKSCSFPLVELWYSLSESSESSNSSFNDSFEVPWVVLMLVGIGLNCFASPPAFCLGLYKIIHVGFELIGIIEL